MNLRHPLSDYIIEEGISTNPCADTFCGLSPASEIEAQLMQKESVDVQQSQGVKLWLTFHTYGRMILFPWGGTVDHNGYECNLSDDYADMVSIVDGLVLRTFKKGLLRWHMVPTLQPYTCLTRLGCYVEKVFSKCLH